MPIPPSTTPNPSHPIHTSPNNDNNNYSHITTIPPIASPETKQEDIINTVPSLSPPLLTILTENQQQQQQQPQTSVEEPAPPLKEDIKENGKDIQTNQNPTLPPDEHQPSSSEPNTASSKQVDQQPRHFSPNHSPSNNPNLKRQQKRRTYKLKPELTEAELAALKEKEKAEQEALRKREVFIN
jgi:hypothetical protein